ncbi:hypothetical protein [Bradyrhizobium viridifuturi]|uniref:hypothetical protein n=1 Tax=Bradyrhizobium viridifuturi TaxID=1654716 RepID=UPI000A54C86F|nr:hypothetical protein [Bradyrhizobium viridifuturi]
MSDWDNTFEYAGPGRKRRERLALQEIPNALTPRKHNAAAKSPSERTPKREMKEIGARNLKTRIRLLTILTETYRDVCDESERENIAATGILVSAVRAEMRAIIRLLRDEGLIDERALERRKRNRRRARDR